MNKTILFLIIAIFLFSSCTSGEKPPTYNELREQHGLDTGIESESSSSSEDSAIGNERQPSSEADVPSYDKFVYRLTDDRLDWNKVGMPLKVNLTSGKTTTACIDPLCMHNTEDCPFFDCTGSMIDGEILFYRRGWMQRRENGYTGTEKLCTYHVATGKIQVLEEYTDSLVFLGAYDDVLYYYTAEWENSGNELVCTYHLHRADGKTGKVTDLNLPETYDTTGGFTDNRDYPNILMVSGDTIYWYKYDEDMTATFYTSDLNAAAWTELEKGVKTFANIYQGGYGYSVGAVMELIDPDAGMTKENLTCSYYLIRRKIGENEPERIAENIGNSNFIVTDRYIYMLEGLNPVPDNLVVQSDPYSSGSATYEILNGCRVFRMNHDGSERIQIAETDAYCFAGKQYIHDEVLFGYYEDGETTYLAFFYMEKNEKGELCLSNNTLILDTISGKFTVSEYID